MNVFERSWKILKLSLDVMKKDKELFLFPLFGGIFSILFMIAMIFPIIIVTPASEKVGTGLSLYAVIFIVYFGLAMIATFFNTCVVYTVKTRFEGKNATFLDSIKFTLSRIHLVIAWGLISATVGLLLRIIDEIGERMGAVGEVIVKIITSILGAVWSIITLFVIPAMVYHNVGPIDAIKRSAKALKSAWGESLIRYYGLGIIQIILIVVGIILGIVLAMATSSITLLFYTIILLTIIYVVAVIVFFNLANTIFNTALYFYADTGKLPDAYNSEIIKNAFQNKEK